MSIFLVTLMYALWSSMFSLGKLALEHAPPLFLTAARMLLAGLLLMIYLFLKDRWFNRKKALSRFKWTWKQFCSIALLGLFSIYLANAFEFWSLQRLSAAKTCFIYSLSP